MNRSLTVEHDIHFQRKGRGSRRVMESGSVPLVPGPMGRVPRVAKLLALAIRFEKLVHAGEVADYAELARLGHVSRARITQIMNLLMLAPDIQEQILFLPRVERGDDLIHMWQLQAIARVPDWKRQQQLWMELMIGLCASESP